MAKKILIIEDDQTTVKIIQNFLQSHDFEVSVAYDGQEGLRKLKENPPQLVILDIQMPIMNGYTFVFEIKKLPNLKDIPIIVLTAKEGMAEIFKVEGVKEYVVKPIQPDSLLEKVNKYI